MLTIELSEVDASLFREFRRVQDIFGILCNSGVFDIRNGKASLNFDSAGTLTDIDFTSKAYKRGRVVSTAT